MQIVNSTTGIPLFGIDFIGILDRGTNVLEVKPITICNLRCKYCFVASGDYKQNFRADKDYLIQWIKSAIEIKQCDDLEIHLAPYGEILLYPQLDDLISDIRMLPQVKIISMQTNGMLLTPEIIQKLQKVGLDRMNISLNSMNEDQCANLCQVKKYDLSHLLLMFDEVLRSSMELLVAPVWFRGENDQGINDIIDFALQKENEGYHWPKFRLGIQNYLSYSTGRRLKRIRERDFGFFYKTLRKMENETGMKLKLGPNDFGIHRAAPISSSVKIGDIVPVEIVETGRWDNEYIGRIDDQWGVKVLSSKSLPIGSKIRLKFIKSPLRGNLLTATADY